MSERANLTRFMCAVLGAYAHYAELGQPPRILHINPLTWDRLLGQGGTDEGGGVHCSDKKIGGQLRVETDEDIYRGDFRFSLYLPAVKGRKNGDS